MRYFIGNWKMFGVPKSINILRKIILFTSYLTEYQSIIGLFLFSLVGYGIYLTWGAGKTDLRDPIDEHAKMHELGIAHGHGGNKDAYVMSGKLDKNHTHET